ncbi:chemotaxis protein CheW, partial [Xanthomonas perforans]
MPRSITGTTWPRRFMMPSMALGIMNLRGQVVPVIDLGIHLGSSP